MARKRKDDDQNKPAKSSAAEVVVVPAGGEELPGARTSDDELLAKAVEEINGLYIRRGLEMALEMGKYVVDSFFDGDVENFARHNRDHVSFRALGNRDDLQVSYNTIWYATAVYAQQHKLPEACRLALPLTHQRLLLPVKDPKVKARLANKALKKQMSTRDKALLAAVIGHVFHRACGQVRYHRHVLVALLVRGLIDAQAGRYMLLFASLAASHRPAHDAVHLVPAQPQKLRRRRDVRLLQPVDHQRLEQRCEPGARLGPGDLDLLDAVLIAVAAGHVSDEDGRELAGVQVAPPAGQRIVAAAGLPAFRALKGRMFATLQEHLHLLALAVKFYLHHLPRLLNSKDLRVQLFVSHPLEHTPSTPPRYRLQRRSGRQGSGHAAHTNSRRACLFHNGNTAVSFMNGAPGGSVKIHDCVFWPCRDWHVVAIRTAGEALRNRFYILGPPTLPVTKDEYLRVYKNEAAPNFQLLAYLPAVGLFPPMSNDLNRFIKTMVSDPYVPLGLPKDSFDDELGYLPGTKGKDLYNYVFSDTDCTRSWDNSYRCGKGLSIAWALTYRPDRKRLARFGNGAFVEIVPPKHGKTEVQYHYRAKHYEPPIQGLAWDGLSYWGVNRDDHLLHRFIVRP